MCFFFDFVLFLSQTKYSSVLFNNFASGAADNDIGDQLVFSCSRPVFKLSGEIKFDSLIDMAMGFGLWDKITEVDYLLL